MAISNGDYYNFGKTSESNRFMTTLAQKPKAGVPRYIIDTDLRDASIMAMRGAQRLGQVFPAGRVGSAAWQLAVDAAPANNFNILGGGGSDETLARLYLGGFPCVLNQDVDWKCSTAFAQQADQIHHRATDFAVNTFTDANANWTVGIFNGLGHVVVFEGVEYTIASNTATTLTVAGLTQPLIDARTTDYYYIKLATPAAATTYDVYVDCFIRDVGMQEEPLLNHAPAGSPVESARRYKLIQQVRVAQVANQFQTVDYIDTVGEQHYVAKLGTVTVDVGTGNGSAVETTLHPDFGSSGEVIAARDFNDACVAAVDLPTTLTERLSRDHHYVTVGDGVATFGRFNGPTGLQAALNCRAQTIVLLNGTYTLSALLTIPSGVRIIGESVGGAVIVSAPLVGGYGITVGTGAHIENVTLRRFIATIAGTALIRVEDAASFYNCLFDDQHTLDEVLLYIETTSVNTGSVELTSCVMTSLVGRIINAPAMVGGAGEKSINFLNCEMSRTGSSSIALVYIKGGQLHFDSCQFNLTSGAIDCQLYSPAIGTPHGTPTYNDSLILQNCDFNYIGSAATPASSSAVRLETGRVKIDGCSFGTLGTVSANVPTFGIDCAQPLGAYAGGYLTATITNNHMKASQRLIQVGQVVNYGEYIITGNTVSGSVDIPLYYGIATSVPGAFTGSLVVSDNIVYASADTVACFFISGGGLVDNNKAICTKQNLNLMVDVGLDTILGFQVQGGTMDVQVNNCSVIDGGGHGFLVEPVGVGIVSISDCSVAGNSRTQRGIWVRGNGTCHINGGTLRNLRASGIYDSATNDLKVSNIYLDNCVLDIAAPSEAAAIYGCTHISNCSIDTTNQYGINTKATRSKSISGCQITSNASTTACININSDNCHIVGCHFSGSAYGVFCSINDYLSVSGCTFDMDGAVGVYTGGDYWVVSSSTFSLTPSKNSSSLVCPAGSAYGTLQSSSFFTVGTGLLAPSILISGINTSVLDNRIVSRGGVGPLSILSAGSCQVVGNYVDGGRISTTASQPAADFSINISVGLGSSIVASHNTVTMGLYTQSFVLGGSDIHTVQGNTCIDGGMTVLNGRRTVENNHVTRNSLHATDPLGRSGLWMGTDISEGLGTNTSESVSHNTIYVANSVEPVMGTPGDMTTLAAAVRSGGVVWHPGDSSVCSHNTVTTGGAPCFILGHSDNGVGGIMYGIGTDLTMVANTTYAGSADIHILMVQPQSALGGVNIIQFMSNMIMSKGAPLYTVAMYNLTGLDTVRIQGGAADYNCSPGGAYTLTIHSPLVPAVKAAPGLQ